MTRYVVKVLLFITCAGLEQKCLGDSSMLLTVITNPSPASENFFGWAVAPFGADRMLISAPSQDVLPAYTGAVSLFSSNGELLTTMTNPSGLLEEQFGESLTGIGDEWVAIGAPYAGSYIGGSGTVYLFNTNGTLLNTIRNPTPEPFDHLDSFGQSLAPFGTNALLVGAYDQYNWKVMPGTVYLLDTSGHAINTFTNPLPETNGLFGKSIAAVGPDRVLIGAPLNIINGVQSGAAYLYHTNGSLLKTFYDPTPAPYHNYFGVEVVALGTDRVMISRQGASFIFNTNGTFLARILAPANVLLFGTHVSVSADHRLLFGGVGSSCIYSTNGTILACLTGPYSTTNDFGSATWVGRDRVVIGATDSNFSGPDSGVAYLFRVVPEPAALRIRFSSPNSISVSWPSSLAGWTLQQNTDSGQSLNWSNVTDGIVDDGATRTLIVSPPLGNRFFRLASP